MALFFRQREWPSSYDCLLSVVNYIEIDIPEKRMNLSTNVGYDLRDIRQTRREIFSFRHVH